MTKEIIKFIYLIVFVCAIISWAVCLALNKSTESWIAVSFIWIGTLGMNQNK